VHSSYATKLYSCSNSDSFAQVFKVVAQPDTIGNRLKEVQAATQDLDKFGKMVELVGLAPFQGTQDALQGTWALYKAALRKGTNECPS